MTNPDDLLAAIIADPANNDLRLVFADLLDDRGEGERAEFIRVQVEKESVPICEHERDMGCAPAFCRRCRLNGREATLMLHDMPKGWHGLPDDWFVSRRAAPPDWTPPCDVYKAWARARRGFIDHITCTYEGWARHADAITARCPIERVTLTTWPQSYGTFLNNNYKLIGVNNSAAVTHEEAFPASMQWQDLAAELVKRTWPRIAFTLPSEVAV